MAARKRVPQIHPVESRKEKQTTYQEQIKQYQKAIQYGFYFEAVMIDYACLEDRLRYMLYYLGVLQKEDEYKVASPGSERVGCFRELLHQYISPDARMSISGIKEKRQIVEAVFRFASEAEQPLPKTKTQSILWNALHDPERAAEILMILSEIGDWCAYRNEIVHSLLNKKMDSLHEKLEDQARKGHDLFRKLDREVRWVRQKKIRDKLKL
ncbi:MAG: hypothetical protein IKG87_17065 [Clostridia bacterium]|nr:hypothetical protein [Clostridia bacterium]